MEEPYAKQRRITPRWPVALGLTVAAIGLWIWFASRPALVWYISPPLDSRGLRAKVLVPRGWEMRVRESTVPNGRLSANDRVILWFEPRPLPRWLSFLLDRKGDRGTAICIDLALSLEDLGLNPANPADGTEQSWTPISLFARTSFGSYRTIKAGNPPIFGDVFLGSSDKTRFDALHSAVCGSFRIEQGIFAQNE